MPAAITPDTASPFHSHLSFRPLVESLKKNIEEGNPGMRKLYGQVVEQFEQHPELMQTIHDMRIVDDHAELIQELLSAVFPPTTANFMYGVSVPFQPKAVYCSPRFREQLLKPGTQEIQVPESDLITDLNRDRLQFAYGLVLKKFLHYNAPESWRSVYVYTDPDTGLNRFMEMRMDARFIEISPRGEMPPMPESMLDQRSNRILSIPELMEQVPLDHFMFEGVTVIRVNDMTEQEVVSLIKNRLLDINAFSDATLFTELENHLQCLIGLPQVTIGVTPFFKINNHYVYSDLHNNNSLLFRRLHTAADKDEISDYCKLLFRDNHHPILFSTITEQALTDVQCLQYYHMEGARSLILCPLVMNHELIGILEIMSPEPGWLKPAHLHKVGPAIPLFTLGLDNGLDHLNAEVDRVIKKKFTAVQPAVEWKFTETALNYIVNKQQNQEQARIEKIVFPDVYPLYAAIDVRNSSKTRGECIQRDLVEQLELARKVILHAQSGQQFPLLQEIAFKLDQYLLQTKEPLKSEAEAAIQEFMLTQVRAAFQHLRNTEVSVKNEIEEYFASLDPQLGMVYHHRKEYEQSISRINETLSHFIDKEQLPAQKVYPHYFERYVTDGLEFNMYIGQSLAPRKRFDEIYLRNLRMWQLTVIAKLARITHALESELSQPLRTTQLILCHSQPLSITFRTEERKFDVDGAYNIRYEIVKKRIDKALIKNTEERLTQPGKIAIVYGQPKEAQEYREYIEFLQSKELLEPGIEELDLEEMQGVIGLKALRVDVKY